MLGSFRACLVKEVVDPLDEAGVASMLAFAVIAIQKRILDLLRQLMPGTFQVDAIAPGDAVGKPLAVTSHPLAQCAI